MEQKREIVAESLGPDLTPSEVARKHAISSGQLYTWRQQLLSVAPPPAVRTLPRFAEVALEPSPSLAPPADPAHVEARPSPAAPAPARPEGLIEIVLPGGVVVRMDAHVDGCALRRVLGALERR